MSLQGPNFVTSPRDQGNSPMPVTKSKQSEAHLTPIEESWMWSVFQETGLTYPTFADAVDDAFVVSNIKKGEPVIEHSLSDVKKKTPQLKATLRELRQDLNSSFSSEVTEKALDHFLSSKSDLPREKLIEKLCHKPRKDFELAREQIKASIEKAHAYGKRLTLEVFFEGAAVPDTPQKAAELLTTRIIELAKNSDAAGISGIVRSLCFLEGADNAVLKKAVSISLKAVHEALVYPESVRKQNAAQGGDVVRVPGEVTTHLLALIRNEIQKPALSPKQAVVLGEIDGQVKDQILSHKLLVADTRVLLASVTERLLGAGLRDLTVQTTKLLAQLGESDNPPLTRLQDAIYSRVLDSTFIADLVHDTPQPVLESAHKMKGGLNDLMNHQTPRVREFTAMSIHDTLSGKRRFWMPECPELMEMAQGTRNDALRSLNKFLAAPTRNGYDAIAIPMLVTGVAVCLHGCLTKVYSKDRRILCMDDGRRVPDMVTYMQAAGQTYVEIIREQNRTDAPEDMERTGKEKHSTGRTEKPKNVHAGITLGYQPPSVSFEGDMNKTPSSHPAEYILPKLQNPSQSQVVSLSHGIPFASGASGTTNVNLYFLQYMKDTCDNLDQVPDSKEYMLATAMFLNYDGGHSIHEALWVGQKLDDTLGLDLGLAKLNPDGTQIDALNYVSDLNEFIDLYDGTDTGRSMQRARENAFEATIDYFDNHSYAAGKPVGEDRA